MAVYVSKARETGCGPWKFSLISYDQLEFNLLFLQKNTNEVVSLWWSYFEKLLSLSFY